MGVHKQPEQLYTHLNEDIVEHSVFDTEQLLSTSTFFAEGELSGDNSLTRAWMTSSCRIHPNWVQAAATMRTSRSLAVKEETEEARCLKNQFSFKSMLLHEDSTSPAASALFWSFPWLNSAPQLLRIKGQAVYSLVTY